MGARFALVVLAGCGRVGFELQGSGDANDVTDVGDADAATPLGPFGSPTPIADIPSGATWPSLTGDLLELYYDDINTTGVWRVTRGDTSAPWGPPVRVDEISSTSSDTDPGVSADGLHIWLASSRAGGIGQNDLWYASRADRASLWSTPVPITELNSTADEYGPAPQPGQTVVLFSSFRAGSDDLYVAQRASAVSVWDPPSEIAELNTPSIDSMPFLTAGGLEIFFSSDRPGGSGARDLYTAGRSSISEPFGTPVALAQLSSPAQDDRPWVSPDRRTIVFASDRSGSWQLYEARR